MSERGEAGIAKARSRMDRAEKSASVEEKLSLAEAVIRDHPAPSDPALRLEVARARLMRCSFMPMESEDRLREAQKTLAFIDADDSAAMKRLGAKTRRNFLHSPFFRIDAAARDRLHDEFIARYRGETEPDMRAYAAEARLALACNEKRLARQVEICRSIIDDYIADTGPETEEVVLSAAWRMLSWLDGYGEDGEELALCNRIIARYCKSEDDENRSFLKTIIKRKRKLTGDTAAQLAAVDRSLEKLLTNPAGFPSRDAQQYINDKARLGNLPIFELTGEWCAAALSKPLSDAAASSVLMFRASMQKDEAGAETLAEVVRRYAASDDPAAVIQAGLALNGLAEKKRLNDLQSCIDTVLKKRDILPPALTGLLLLNKARYDEILDLTDRPPEQSWVRFTPGLPTLLQVRHVALKEKALLTGDPDASLTALKELITRGTGAYDVAREAQHLAGNEPDAARRARIYDMALAACRESPGVPGVAPRHIELLNRKAEETRDAAKAMALYREAVAVYERESLRAALFPPVETVRGMMRLTRERAEKEALYDRVIAMAGKFVDGESRSDTLSMEKAALFGDAQTREKVFAEILEKNKGAILFDLLPPLAEGLRGWIGDCAAAGRDPWVVDTATPTREGETWSEARGEKAAAELERLGVSPAEKYAQALQKGWGDSLLAAGTLLATARETANDAAKRSLLRLLLEIYGGIFEPNMLRATLAARKEQSALPS